MKKMKRLLAMLLCVIMVVGLIPASVFAAETDTDYLFFATDRHTNTSIIATMINNMENKIGENKLEYLGLGGDMVGSGNSHPEYDSSTVLAEVTGATSSLSAANVDIVAGIHDMNVNDDAGIVLDYQNEDGGAQIYEGDKYYVYGVPESCISGAVSGIDPETEANDFVTWANGSDIDKSKVIFVLSHYPLHQRRNDNDGAVYWAEALNTVAVGDDTTIDRDIAFFWGHNHTGESSADTAVYHVAPQGSISVQGGSSNQTIYFTYANAGYLNAKSSATLVEITDTTITFNKYTNSSYTSNTVTRVVTETAPALESISISGTTEYAIGDKLELTVTATYSDGTTADVTAAADLSGYDMSVGGAYTVTAEYEGLTAEYAIQVNPVTVSVECANSDIITATGDNLTDITAEWKDIDLTAAFGDADPTVYDIALTGYTENQSVQISLDIVGLPVDGLKLYYVNADGTTEAITPDSVTATDVGAIVTFTTTKVGTFAVGVPEITVPTGADLTGITVTAPETTKYFVEDANADDILPLDITGLTVTATYSDGTTTTEKEIEWNEFGAIADGYSLTFDMTKLGYQDVTVSYTYTGTAEVTETGTFQIWIGSRTFTSSDETVSVTVENPGTTAIVVSDEITDAATAAIAHLVNDYAVYNITLASIDGKGLDGGTASVTLPVPEGVENPAVYYVSDDGKTVTNMNATVNSDGTVTFTTDHFSTYVVGESTEITVPDPTTQTVTGATTTEEKDVYVLVSTPAAGNQYIIVSSGSAGSGYALKENTTAGTSVTINAASGNITAPYIETSDTTIMWNATSGLNFQSQNGGYYLNYSNSSSGGGPGSSGYSLSFGTSSSNASDWTAGTNQLYRDGQRNDYWLRYNSGWTMGNSTNNVYFYEKQTVSVTTSADGTYSIAGNPAEVSKVVVEDTTATLGSTLTFTPESGSATTTDTSTTATYTVVDGGDPNGIISDISGNTVIFSGKYGKALVKVTYTSTDPAYTVTNYIVITATAPVYSIEITTDDGDESTAPAETDIVTDTVVKKGVTSTTTLDLGSIVYYEDSDGKEVVTNPTGSISWMIPTDKQSIATIDQNGVVTFKGVNGSFNVIVTYEISEGKYVTDTITVSASVSEYTVPEDGTDDFPDYPNEGAIRFDKHATAVGTFSETGIAQVELSMTGVPYTTGSEIDVVVMLDMTGSMSDNGMEAAEEATKAFVKTIVTNEDGSYNDNRVAVYAFNSGSSSPYELVALGTIDNDSELETANTAIDTASDKQASGGTPFDEAAKQCYDVLQAAKADGIGNNRQQFCVFMSDGGPTAYRATYDNTNGYLDISNSGSGTSAITNYLSGYTSSTSTDWSFTLPTEYYTDLMKADGVTVYTVGLLLQTAPSNPAPYSSMTDSTYNSTTDSLTTIGSHYYFTSAILKQMATDESKYIDIFNVDNASKATAAFESIAKEILDAAKDVVVEDKISDDYTMVFEAPNTTVEDALPGDQEFYIEVKEYTLTAVTDSEGNITDYVRGDANSLMKVYLGWNTTDTPNHYYAASDANGTAHATPVFATTAVGSKYYWTTDSTKGDSGVSVVGSDGTTYYFISSGDGTHNMTSGAYAYGTLTEQTISVTDPETGNITETTSNTSQDLIIATPYFVYNASTRMLVWTAEKLNSSELALSYFLYLDESGGWTGASDEVDPGTYETNDWATLTYTNFNGNECQQEFPVPQMTWNGAQVSYVFYLVNEYGQPVNRAGRVIPFSEAVYVTDVYTYSIVWNDLEQMAALEAEYLATDLVPDVYELYDADATYNIHVFEDENEVNLNNHFVIGGTKDVDTTYVFNAKSDATKYNAPGTYAANTTYLCKDYNVTANDDGTYTYTGSNTQYQVNGAYVYDTDEKGTYTIVQKTDATKVETGFDFSNTTVAFAVVWKPRLETDTVVIDYGLDVVIDVAMNDSMTGSVVGVRSAAPSNIAINTGRYDTAKGTSADVYLNGDTAGTKIGTATLESGSSVRFSLDKDLGMQMNKAAVFYYESDVTFYENNVLQSEGMYSSVIVIPATTVYYEDEYVELEVYTDADDALYTGDARVWETAGSTKSETQNVDRPGFDMLSDLYDANNAYGFDSAYETMTEYSMGSARKLTVDSTYFGKVKFSFYGTGFDVISLTSNQTGTIVVQVTDASGNVVRNKLVDTYYGYSLDTADSDSDGNTTEWVVSANDPNALYQVPVITVEDLTYGKYDVTITAAYNSFFAHNSATSYDIYLDAIRIYDPVEAGAVVGKDSEGETANDVTIEDIYAADNEGWPVYEELRNNVISAEGVTTSTDTDGNVTVTFPEDVTLVEGAIFIDSNDASNDITEYVSYGPNNELYLANGQAVAFNVTTSDIVADVQLGIKVANGNTVTYEINGDSYTVNTTTDMYYSILSYAKAGTVVIRNVRGGILSLTNIKVTYTENPYSASESSLLWMDEASASYALMSLRAPVVEEEIPEVTEPETTVPEETEPETTVPEETEPETTEPEETEPEVTEPEETEPEEDPVEEIKNTITNIINKITNALSKLLSKWFR